MPLTLSVATSAIIEMSKSKSFIAYSRDFKCSLLPHDLTVTYKAVVETGVWVKVRRVSCLESEQNGAPREGWTSPLRFSTNAVKWWAQ